MLGRKRLGSLCVVLLLLFLAACATNDGGQESVSSEIPAYVSVTVTVPSGIDGASYGPEEIALHGGDTVYDVLVKTELDVDVTGSGSTAYIRGIEGLKEFDEGPLSGWQYKVDGIYPSVGVGSYELKPGQKVEYIYTTDFTEQ